MKTRFHLTRSIAIGAIVANAAVIGVGVEAGRASAAPAGNDQVIALVVRGTGNGHGRGLSQWGAYGRALAGQSWQEILGAYYGGTEQGFASEPNMRVQLTKWDGSPSIGVISVGATARWNGSTATYASMYAVETSPNRFDVFGAGSLGCPTDGPIAWQQVGDEILGPIVFSSLDEQSAAAPGAVLGLCSSIGTVTHYRGSIELLDAGGVNRVVNQLDVENYLRGVVPKEVSASWGSAGNGIGINALRAQAVAARSYGISQNRDSYAKTCDTTSCQVYGGAASRVYAAASGVVAVEQALTDSAIAATAGAVRFKNGAVASTEFSASNGPRTAGGTFPPVDDPWDDVPSNPNHRWTRVIDADDVIAQYGLATANGVVTAPASSNFTNFRFEGIWANEVRLGIGKQPISALAFRNAFGLPSPGFELIPIRRSTTLPTGFALIGDSVAASVTAGPTSELPALLDGVHAATRFDSIPSRRTQGGTVQPDGVGAAGSVPVGTELVVVELGYNDDPSAMPGRIDAVMAALRARQVGTVAWMTVSERRTSTNFAVTNAAILAARSRWSELVVLDWESASDEVNADRWYSDNVHLTATGRAEFSLWLREEILAQSGRPVVPSVPLRVPVLGRGGVPTTGVTGVALNVTAVGPAAAGWLRVWPCGSPEPETSSVNFAQAGVVEPNGVVVPVDSTGEICIRTLATTDVIVDVAGWFEGALRSATGRLVDTRGATRVLPGSPLHVAVLNQFGVPATGAVGVALNVTAVNPVAAGWLRVWPCGSAEPETSSVNFGWAGAVEPNGVIVPVDATGEVCVGTLVETDVVVDMAGWFDSGVRPATGRLVDTRNAATRLRPGAPLHVAVLGQYGTPLTGVVGVALNVTAVNPVAPGFLRVWPCGSAEPETSAVNYSRAGAVEPNGVVVPVDQTGEVCVSSLVTTDVVVDLAGWFDGGLRGASGTRIVDTRYGIGPIPGR